MRVALMLGAALSAVAGAPLLARSVSTVSRADVARDIDAAPDPDSVSPAAGGDIRSVTINGTPLGEGMALRFRGGLYVDTVLAESAGLRCGRRIERKGRPLCAIPTTAVTIVGDRIDATVPAGGFLPSRLGAAAPVAALPELAPGRLGFFNYNTGAAKVSGGTSLSGAFDAGLRLDENAFDLSGVVARAATPYVSTGLDSTSYSGNLLDYRDGRFSAIVTQAAYRRNWFDQRLSLAIGRTALQTHGLLGGNIFDGVGLSESNLDNLGDVRVVRSRDISGYSAVPGVLTYRIGDTVLKQVPIQAGAYSIDPALFAGLPGGGKIEIVGVDGRISGLDLPLIQTRQVSLYKAGTFDWSVQAGRIRSAGGDYAASLYAGSRYGLSDDLTVEAAGILDPHSVTADGSVDWMLPGALGVTGVDVAFQTRQRNLRLTTTGQTRTGLTLTGYYSKDIGKARFSIDYLRNRGGGVIAGGYYGYGTGNSIGTTIVTTIVTTNTVASSTVIGSTVDEDIRLQASAPLLRSGITGTLRLISTRYTTQSQRARFAEAQVGGGLGRFGNWGTYLHAGRNGTGQQEFSANVFWQKSLGRRTQATLSYQTNRIDGERSQTDRYLGTLSGTTDTGLDQGATYQVSVDQEGRGSASYQRRFSAMDVSTSIYRDAETGVSGQVNARGSIVVADGHVIAGQALSDSVVVLKAPALPDDDVVVDHNTLPRTRTNGVGYAVVSYLRAYKANSAQLTGKDAPLGLEIPDEVLNGTVHPYRGYIVDVATHMSHPARLFLVLPVDPKATPVWAEVNGEQLPVEADGSLYLDDLGRVKSAIRLSWQAGGAAGCTIAIPSLPAVADGDAKSVLQAKGIACR